jgi:hypothetical protein
MVFPATKMRHLLKVASEERWSPHVLCKPGAIAILPNGDLLVFDDGDRRLKVLSTSCTAKPLQVCTPISGSGERAFVDGAREAAAFVGVKSIAVHSDGTRCTLIDLQRIRTANLVTGSVTTLVKDGLNLPLCVAMLPNGKF